MSSEMPSDASMDIDWSAGHIWVADKTPLLIDKETSTSETVRATRPSGEIVELTSQEIDESYYQVADGTILRPKYKPLKAWTITQTSDILLPDGITTFRGPGAILCEDDQTYQFIDLARYERDFTVVGYRGAAYPETPFSS